MVQQDGDYLRAYAALAKKKQEDDAAATAIAPTEGERETVKDQSSLAALVSSLMKAQAGVGSIGGVATANPDINYGQYADINSKDLLARRAKSDDMLRLSDKAFQGGRQSIADSMGAKQFSDQQAQLPLDMAQKQFKFDSMQAEAPIDLEQRKAKLELTKQQILQVGKNPSDVDKDLANLQRIKKIRETARLIEAKDPDKSKELNDNATILESKYGSVKPNLTPAEQAVDKKYAGTYVDYTQNGRAKIDASLNSFDKILNDLNTKNVSGGILGRLPDFLMPRDAIETQQDAAQQSAENIKQTLGTQITEKDREFIVKNSYDATLDESVNLERAIRMRDFLAKKKKDADAQAYYYENEGKGSLKGFKPISQSIEKQNVKKEPSSEDKEAIAWAKANSNDPRAAKIIMKLQGN